MTIDFRETPRLATAAPPWISMPCQKSTCPFRARNSRRSNRRAMPST